MGCGGSEGLGLRRMGAVQAGPNGVVGLRGSGGGEAVWGGPKQGPVGVPRVVCTDEAGHRLRSVRV